MEVSGWFDLWGLELCWDFDGEEGSFVRLLVLMVGGSMMDTLWGRVERK